MTKCQSSQNRFVQAALTAATLAFALTVLPGTALADALPEDQQPAVTEGQVTPAVEEKGNQITYEDGNQTIDEEDEQTYPSDDGQDQAATIDQVSDGAGNVETAAGGSEEDQQDEPVATDTADSLTTDENNSLDSMAVVETEDESQTEQEDAVAGEPATQAEDGPRALLASPALASPSPETEASPAPRTGHWVVDARSGSLERYWVWDDDGSTAKGVLVGPENGAGWYAWAMADGRILRNGKWDGGAGRVYVADNDGRLMGSGMSSDGWVVTRDYDGSWQRYYVDAKAKAARSGFFTVPGYGDVFGMGGQGYVFRGDFQFGGRKWSADNDGRLRSGWYSTSGFGDGAQLYWMGDTVYGSPHAAAAGRLVGPSEGDASGHYAWAMADGRILRGGKWDGGAGRVYVADGDGRLMGSDMSSDGWVVTRDYDGSWQRYYVDAKAKAARSGFFTVEGYGDVFGMGGQGYVLRGVRPWGTSVILADNDGRLPSKEGWDVTDRYGQGTQRYWIEPIYSTYLGAKQGYSEAGYAHYTLPTGYVLRNDAIPVSSTKGYRANNDGLAEEVTFGWYQMSNGHWFYLSLYSYANFETDKYVSGGRIIDLGHYDVLYDLWRKVNGYKSGSNSPYASRTKYLVVSGWDDCYLAVFVGVGDPKKAGYWQPLFGWNCGNGNKNVINRDAQKQAEEEGRTTTWQWDPEWDYYMAEGNTASNKASLDPVKFRYFIQMNTTTNYQMPVVPTNTGERWFTSVKLTLGYHSTITSNPNNELYRHVSHGCIRLDVNNAHILYGLMAPKGTKTVVNGVTYEGVGPGTRCIQLKRGSY